MSLFVSKTYILIFTLHGGFSQITLFIRRLQAPLFLLGLKVQGSLDVCVKFLVYLSRLKDLFSV